MLIRELFSPRNEELISPEVRSFFRKLCSSDWVKCNKDVDYEEYQSRIAEQEAEALNAEV